jgi:AraC-like DNA-binding protein
MNDLSHLKHTGPLSVAVTDFEPFPAISNEDWLGRLLHHITVGGVTAIWHQCVPRWAMKERRVGDDMLFYITRGHGTAWVEGRKFELKPGICAHFPRGKRHAATHDPKNPIHVISVHYTATVFESLTLPELLQFPDFFDLRGDKRMDMMFQAACREYALRPAGYERGLEALILRILLRLIREYSTGMTLDAHESKVADLLRLLPALETIRKNLNQPIFIAELARATGFSEAQFRRVFLRSTGATPVQYLRRVRMERACQLLRQTDQTVDRIAGEVGYAEPAFFAHSFKKLIGISPGRYRSTHEL